LKIGPQDRDHGRGLIIAILARSLVAMATSKDPVLLAYTNKIPYKASPETTHVGKRKGKVKRKGKSRI